MKLVVFLYVIFGLISIVITLLEFSRAEGPRKFQLGDKILITPLYYCAKNLSPNLAFCDA